METNSLIWTKEKPVKAGWYWLRGLDEVSIVQVRMGGELYVVPSGWDDTYALRNVDGEWAGPIPEPREAEAAPAYEDPSPTLLHPKPMVCILTPDEFREKGTMYGQQGAKGLYVQIVGTSKLSDGTPVYEVRA